jgi:hypothetical protein
LCGPPTAFTEEPAPSSPSSQETAAPSTELVSPPEAGEVQERGVFEYRLEPRIFNPQATTPVPPTKIPVPEITAPTPGAALPPDRYQAPTPNLTLIANALRLNHKSLTTLVTLPPNLPVTRPVDIGIIYSSPTGIGQTKQSYAGSTGNRFLYNDREGDGKPRAMKIAITLTEPSAGEAGIYPMKWQANLDPLYDVAMGQFEFTLLNSCDTAGQTEIILAWALPDNQSVTTRGFSTAIIPWKEAIPEFRWVGKEIGWSQPLFKEVFRFYDDDPGWVNFLSDCVGPFFAYAKGCGFSVPLADDSHLLNTPNGGMWVERKLKAENDSCKGKYKYFRNKYLLLYPTLQPR